MSNSNFSSNNCNTDAQEGDDGDSSEDDEPIEDGQLLPRIQKKVAKTGPFCVPKFEQTVSYLLVFVRFYIYINRFYSPSLYLRLHIYQPCL